MQEWKSGLALWHSEKLRTRFRRKYGRSLGSKKYNRVKNLSRLNRKRIRLSYVSSKINSEWAEGVYSRTHRMHLTRSKKKLKQNSRLQLSIDESEWGEGFSYWGNYKLLASSWKWIKPKKLNRSQKRSLKNRFKRKCISISRIQFGKTTSPVSYIQNEVLESEGKIDKTSLIHVYRKGTNFGPYTLEQVQSFVDSGEFTSSDLGFYDGKEYWIPLSCIKGLFFEKKFLKEKKSKLRITYGNEVFRSKSRKLNLLWGFIPVTLFLTVILFFCIFESYKSESNNSNQDFSENKDFQSRKQDKEKFNNLLNEILSNKNKKKKKPNNDFVAIESIESNDFLDYNINDKVKSLDIETKSKKPKLKLGELRSYLVSSVGMKMIWCPPGSFWMGSPKSEQGRSDNEALHKVKVNYGFYLGECEVKQSEWGELYNEKPFHWRGTELPVESVTWTEAMNYCDELTQLEQDSGEIDGNWKFSLPTEVQWEYACRSGTQTTFNIGNNITGEDANINASIPYGISDKGKKSFNTIKCGSFKPNRSGFYDMHGNVWEWCLDWYYPNNLSFTDVLIPKDGLYKVKKGGSWFNGPQNVRSAKRFYSSQKYRHETLGFRVALIKIKQ